MGKNALKSILECSTTSIRRDSGNLPNQKGYVPEYDPAAAFDAQFFDRYAKRYEEKWTDAKFEFVGLATVLGRYLRFEKVAQRVQRWRLNLQSLHGQNGERKCHQLMQ